MKIARPRRFKTIQITIAALCAALSSCGGNHSKLDANVGSRPVIIPAKIQAEDFNSAIDLSEGNRGHKCDQTSNPNVDIEVANDDGGGCAIGWTQNDEMVDYFVINPTKNVKTYDIELRIASADKNSEIVVESPPGSERGKVHAHEEGYRSGWQNWVTRTVKSVSIHPGQQVIRILFKGEQNLNYIVVKEDGKPAPDAPKPRPQPVPVLNVEQILRKSCLPCHAYLKDGDKLNWAQVEARASKYKDRLTDSVAPMPPKGDAKFQMSPAEQNVLLQHVTQLASKPKEEAKPIATSKFESRGMKLQRDLMAENAGHIWGMVFLPDGDILMSIKTGGVKRFNISKRSLQNVLGGPNAAQHGQGGLLDIGISQNFKNDHRVYFTHAKSIGNGQFTTAISTGILDGNQINDLKELFAAKVGNRDNTKGEHFGGRIVVDKDSSIWLSVGERNVRQNAQDLSNHLGKILHLNADGSAHSENPFHGRPGALPEIFSFGHRNPQGLTRNQLTNEIWETEHGPQGGDEVNAIKRGLNYGWPLATYGVEYGGAYLAGTHANGTEQPMHYWAPSIAPSGFIVYSADALPGWKGLSISGSLVLSHLNLTEIKNGRKVFEERLFDAEPHRVREVEQSPSGDVWYSTDAGHLFRIKKTN